MVARYETWTTDAAESLVFWHGDSAVHTAASDGATTTLTLLAAEITHGVDENAVAEFVARTSDATIKRGDYLTVDGKKWRLMLVVDEGDGLYRIEAVRAQERN